jgi:hypothetical protein
MPYRFNAITGKLDWTDPIAAETDPVFAAAVSSLAPFGVVYRRVTTGDLAATNNFTTDGLGHVGIGISYDNQSALIAQQTFDATGYGGLYYGMKFTPILDPTANSFSTIYGFGLFPTIANVSYDTSELFGLNVEPQIHHKAGAIADFVVGQIHRLTLDYDSAGTINEYNGSYYADVIKSGLSSETITLGKHIYLAKLTKATTNWQIYSEGGNIYLGDDNSKTIWGTGQEWSIYNDANNLVLNRESGTGLVKIPTLTASKLVFTDASQRLTSTGIGTSSQFIKGDGSLDSSTYLTSASSLDPSKVSQAATYRFVSDTEKSTWNGKQAALNGTGFVKASGTTISYDNSTYLTSLSGALLATGATTGATSQDQTFTNAVSAKHHWGTDATLPIFGTADATKRVLFGAFDAAYARQGAYVQMFGKNYDATYGGNFQFTLDATGLNATPTVKFFSSNYAALMTIQNDGKVGIGTEAPGALLDVAGAINLNGALKSVSPLGGGANTSFKIAGVGYGANYSASTAFYTYDYRGGASYDYYEAMRIQADGKVAIGATNPLTTLESNGTKSTPTPEAVFNLYRPFNAGAYFDSGASFALSTPDSGTTNTRLDINLLNVMTGTKSLPEVTVMTLLSSGNVGIGTTAPGAKLQVAADTAYTNQNSTLAVTNYSYPNFRMYMGYDTNVGGAYIQSVEFGTAWKPILLNPNGGNVGIGTTAPDAPLTIKGSGTGVIQTGQWVGSSNYAGYYLNGDWTTSTNYNFLSSPGDKNLYINRPTGSSIYFREGGSAYQMTLATSGNVGIGTTNPQAILDIVGGRIRTSAGIEQWDGANFQCAFAHETASGFTGIYGDGNGITATPDIKIDGTTVSVRGSLYVPTAIGIGTAPTTGLLHLNRSAYGDMIYMSDGTSAGTFTTYSSKAIAFRANTTGTSVGFFNQAVSGGMFIEERVSGNILNTNEMGCCLPTGWTWAVQHGTSAGTNVRLAVNSSGGVVIPSLTSGRVSYSTTGGLQTDSANFTFDGTLAYISGGLGLGAAASASYVLNAAKTFDINSGLGQGMRFVPTLASTADGTASIYGINIYPTVAGNGYDTNIVCGQYIEPNINHTAGAVTNTVYGQIFAGYCPATSAGTVTNWYQNRIGDVVKHASSTETITNLYGLYIDQQTKGGTNYQIYSVAGNVYIGAGNIVTDTSTGMKIGTVGGASGQKLGFFNATPIVQPVLATGASKTVDNVITVLQNLGLVRQS